MPYLLILIVVCVCGLALAYISDRTSAERARDVSRSNARVLREFKRIARQEPNKIINTRQKWKGTP